MRIHQPGELRLGSEDMNGVLGQCASPCRSPSRGLDRECVVSVFTDRDLEFLHGTRRLGRIATVGRDGTPHVTPVGWLHNVEHDTIDVGGHDVAATKRFRDVSVSGRAAIVIDDVVSTNPWRPRAIEVPGRAEAVGDPHALIRIYPERIVSWGIEPARHSRTVPSTP
jgi:pyridoxamine 5'-phosphate oxidase family protein